MTDDGSRNPTSFQASEPLIGGCILVVFKALLGPALVLVSGLCLIINKAQLGSGWDYFFLGALAATILAGLLTPPKAPASPPHSGDVPPMSRGKYLAIILGLGAALFTFGHFVAPKLF